MTTADLKNDQLPNNRLEVFKSNTKLVKASDGLFNCSLKLLDGSSITIPMREDGMINATMLCKAHGKKLLTNYTRNKETKEYLEELSSDMRISITQLIEVCKGNTSKFQQGTWVHRKVAIHLAQWLSPNFAVQVSNWLDELFITGKVELGQEKSNKELENKFQEQIKLLTQEKETISRQLTSVTQNHNKMLKRRRRGVYEIGNVVYIMFHVAFTKHLQSKDFYLYN
uniref:KilA-N domain-containing protein n=1 Tax=viral metagenome TaxID=1070528 RepID=A0A6C0H300_9ZZZZ